MDKLLDAFMLGSEGRGIGEDRVWALSILYVDCLYYLKNENENFYSHA